MLKIIVLLISSAYIVYFITTPPLTIHDESSHIEIIASISGGQYPYVSGDFSKEKQLGANERLSESLQYVDHPYQIPRFEKLSQLKEDKADYDTINVFSHQAYSPPFYYLVGVIFYYFSKITPYLLGQFYIMRLTSATFYFGTVFIAWKILLIFFKNKKTASSILLFFALNPLVLKMGIGVNPDIGVTFFSLCVLYTVLKFLSKPLNFKSVAKVSILSAIATLTKISGIFTNAFFMLYVLVFLGFRRKTIHYIIIFQGIFLAVTFMWFRFAFNRYDTFFPEPFSNYCMKLGNDIFINRFIETFSAFRFTIMNYAGFMGEGWPYPFKWFFVGYIIFFLISSICGLFFVLKKRKRQYKTLIIYTIPMFLLLIAQSGMYRIKQIDCDIQGRYMMPVFFVLCLFVFWGIFYFTKNEKRASQIVLGFAVFHYLFILFTVLILRYYV